MDTQKENVCINSNTSSCMLRNMDFLQSLEWARFQESAGRKTFSVAGDGFNASVVEHALPLVGKYFYIPRGPVISARAGIQYGNSDLDTGSRIKSGMTALIELAKKNKAGWVRIEMANEKTLEAIRTWTFDVQVGIGIWGHQMSFTKSPHDMQPKEIFVIDIEKPEEQLLAEMKAKTRYNIRLAEKREVRIKKQEVRGEYIDEFIRLTQVMAKRQEIQAHP